MSREDNIKVQQRMGELINAGEFDRLGEVMADDVVDRDPAPDQGPGPEGFASFFRTLSGAFPDAKIEVETLVADDDNVAFAYTLTGTHRGDFMGVAPTGRSITARGMQISRFEGGKIVERWGSTDELGILHQVSDQVKVVAPAAGSAAGPSEG